MNARKPVLAGDEAPPPERFPRLLVVNGMSPTDSSASGRMLTNILSAWPKEKLAYLQVGGDPSASPRKDFRSISGVYGRLVRSRNRWSLSRAAGGEGAGRALGGVRRRIKSTALAYLELLPVKLNAETVAWLDEFSPEVIYSWLGNPAIHDMVRNISNRRKIPTVVHIMDDWISCKHSGDWAVAPSRRALVRSFEREIACATNCIAISAKMAAEYAARYGRPFEVIANAIDLRNFPPALRAYSPRRLRLGHVGRISAGRLQALKNVATALGRLEQRGWAVGLELVGVTREELPVDLQNSSLVHCCPSDSDEEIKALGQRVDALLQAESFDPQENAWFRHSLSAKLPLYLALGRPILAYGPRDLGSIAYVETAGCGVVVDSLAVERLVDLCEQFAGDSIRMERMGKRSREVAEEYHDRTRVCAMFRDLIVEAAGWNATTGNGLTASSGKKKHD